MSYRPKAGDIILAAAVIAAALLLLFLFPKTEGRTANIYKDGRLYASYALDEIDEPIAVTIEGKYTNAITVSGEGAEFTSSDCPDGTCVHTGKISSAGEFAACAPNRVLIEIEGDGGLDAVTG